MTTMKSSAGVLAGAPFWSAVASSHRFGSFSVAAKEDEQKRRLESRLKDAHKNWKFNPGDLEERKRWDDYMAAFEDALGKCSTERAPWYVIPANKKWFRNWAVSDVIDRTLKTLDLQYPKAIKGIEKFKVE